MNPAKRVLIVLDVAVGRSTAHVRGRRYEDKFRESGWVVEFVDVGEASVREIVDRARSFPVVYLVKTRSLELLRALKASTDAKVVFDLTDALWQTSFRREWSNVELIVSEADAIFSENTFVCDWARRLNERVISIPVCTQVELFERTAREEPELTRRGEGVRIGWIGSQTTVVALTKIRAQLEAVCAAHPKVVLRFVGTGNADFSDWRGRVETVPMYDDVRMIREILQMDIGLFPAPSDLHEYAIRGAQKGMLYMTGGAVAVCENAGDCARRIRHGVTGMLVDDRHDWQSVLDELVRSPERRARIADAARVQMRPHSLEAVFGTLERSLLEVQGVSRRPSTSQRLRARGGKLVRDMRFEAERFSKRARKRIARMRAK